MYNIIKNRDHSSTTYRQRRLLSNYINKMILKEK